MKKIDYFFILSSFLSVHPTLADERPTFNGKTVDAWIEILRDKTHREREQAVRALGYFGPAARASVPDLIEILRNDGGGQPQPPGAVETLGRIGPAAAPAVPLLIESFVRQGCVHLTGAGAIRSPTTNKDALVRIGAAAVPALLEVLKGPDLDMRVCAAEALGEIGPAAQAAVPALIGALRRERPILDLTDSHSQTFRHHAIVALGELGPEARVAVPALESLLFKQEKAVLLGSFSETSAIVEALARLGSPPVTRLLRAFLHEEDDEAADELARLGPQAKSAVPQLRRAMTDDRLEVRIEAAALLALIDPPAPDALPVLIDSLENPIDVDDKLGIVFQALARLGPSAAAATPSLLKRLKKEGDSTVIKTLVEVDPEGKACIPALIAALDDKNSYVVSVTTECLGLLGPRAKAAVPALATVVTRHFRDADAIVYTDNNANPQVSSAKALGRIGPAAHPAIPALVAALKFRRNASDHGAATAAARVLGSFGPAAKAAVPALIDALQLWEKDDANWTVRREAALALGRIGPDAKAAIPTLRVLVSEAPSQVSRGVVDPPLQVGDAALIALYHLAPDGKELAERWVAAGHDPERRAIVLGAMGRPSLEADGRTRSCLEQLDRTMSEDLETEGPADEIERIEGWIERLGSYGVGARLAVPRLNELRRHRNPWIRLWAGEALAQIVPSDRAVKTNAVKAE